MTDQPPSPREVIARWIIEVKDEPMAGHGYDECSSCRNLSDSEAGGLLDTLRSRGYVVVPREPTPDMVSAVAWGDYTTFSYGGGTNDFTYFSAENAADVWRAMIDAANPGGGGKG
jgi:hypothetical protein